MSERHAVWLGRFGILVVVCLVGAALCSTIGGQSPCTTPSLNSPVSYDTGLFASGVALGDFNQDGALDMAVTNQNASSVSVLPGNGRGGFGPKVDFATGGPPQRIIAADLNRDNALDLILPIQSANIVTILWGDGRGGFVRRTTLPLDGAPFMPAAADFNADGFLDLAVTTTAAGSRRVAVFLGDGAGGFAAPSFVGSFGNSPIALGIADFNGDGRPDFAVGAGPNVPPNTNNLSVFLGNGRGGFELSASYTIGPAPQSISIADFNGDGAPDIAVSNSLPAGTNSTVSVLLGRGDGRFMERMPFSIGEGGRGTGVADFNQDGRLDLAVANSTSNTVSVLLGDGHGGFGAKADFSVGRNPRKIAVGDVNHDGRPDIITPNTGSNDVSVLINSCAP